MDSFDPAFHSNAVYGWKPFLSLAIFTCIGAFFTGALFTAVRRGIKDEGWFNLKNKDDNN